MATEITYESICEKLGFDVDTYEPPLSDIEDDSMESPFRSLSLEELSFLTDRIENRKERKLASGNATIKGIKSTEK